MSQFKGSFQGGRPRASFKAKTLIGRLDRGQPVEAPRLEHELTRKAAHRLRDRIDERPGGAPRGLRIRRSDRPGPCLDAAKVECDATDWKLTKYALGEKIRS